MRMANKIIIFTDADNTLWDTNKVFADAQLAILDDVESVVGHKAQSPDRLQYVRNFDQEIASRHHSGLRYPPRFLAEALALGLQGMEPRVAFDEVWSRLGDKVNVRADVLDSIQRDFFTRLKVKPQLRRGVRVGLEWSKESRIPVIVVTEGEKERVIETLSQHGLMPLVERVIEGKKSPSLYARIRRLVDPMACAFMIGDQIDKDIAPAQEAGAKGIYFPGGFDPVWSKRITNVEPDFVVKSFDEISDIVQEAVVIER